MKLIKSLEEFEDVVIRAGKPVVVDFYADWCGPCRALAPIMESVAHKKQGLAEFAKVNVDEVAELTFKYGIMTIPTLLFFKDGEVKNKSVGLINEDELTNFVDMLIND